MYPHVTRNAITDWRQSGAPEVCSSYLGFITDSLWADGAYSASLTGGNFPQEMDLDGRSEDRMELIEKSIARLLFNKQFEILQKKLKKEFREYLKECFKYQDIIYFL